MKRCLITFLLLMSPWFAQAKGVTYPQLKIMQNSALIDRLNLILENRLELLKACDDGGFKKSAQSLNQYLNSKDLSDIEITARQDQILNLQLNYLRASRTLEMKCLGTSEIKSTKKPFPFSKNTENQSNPINRLWWKTLEPSCYKIRLKGNLKGVDTNACFAGDRVLLNAFERLQKDPAEVSLRYSYSLLSDLEHTSPGAVFDLEKSFFNEFNTDNRQLLMAILGAISTSGPSGLTGWLQGLEDRLLVRDLNSKKSNVQILKHFADLQEAKYNYILLRDLADQYHVKIHLYGQDVSSWNRHNMMAAFLGCSLGPGFEKKTPALIYLTGVAYETKDFFSHLKEGVSLKASEQNFVEDTTRYRVSGSFGYNLCLK